MATVAVIAHGRKTFGAGLAELRRRLDTEVGTDVLWHEVAKSRKAPKAAQRCLEAGADLILVWGGDGTVQRVVDATAGSGVTLGILPAGTANLLAHNLGIPIDLDGALDVALHGARRHLDVGVINGERFAVMAGAGLDAVMIRDADGKLKDRFGRLAYVVSGVRGTGQEPMEVKVEVDGDHWFEGRAGCLLFASMGTLTGGLVAFPDADPTDGLLEVGVVTAGTRLEWARVVGRVALGSVESSPLTQTTRGRKVKVRFDRPTPYELDGGTRPKVKKLKVRVKQAAVRFAVPSHDGVVAGPARDVRRHLAEGAAAEALPSTRRR